MTLAVFILSPMAIKPCSHCCALSSWAVCNVGSGAMFGVLCVLVLQVAPTLVPPSSKARASGLMTVAFQSSCFLALLGAAAIQRLTASSGLTSGGAPAGSLH